VLAAPVASISAFQPKMEHMTVTLLPRRIQLQNTSAATLENARFYSVVYSMSGEQLGSSEIEVLPSVNAGQRVWNSSQWKINFAQPLSQYRVCSYLLLSDGTTADTSCLAYSTVPVLGWGGGLAFVLCCFLMLLFVMRSKTLQKKIPQYSCNEQKKHR